MVPVIVLAVAFVVFRLAGLALPYFDDWQLSLRAALGVMFLLTASAHWGRRRADLIRMAPAFFGSAPRWVTLTGVAEIFIAAGLQIQRAAMSAALVAMVMLVGIFPANAKAARENLTIGRRPVPPLGTRLVIQLIFLGALAASVWVR